MQRIALSDITSRYQKAASKTQVAATNRSPPTLPTEIWEHVIDCLQESLTVNVFVCSPIRLSKELISRRRQTLLACCLTHRLWLVRSRRHLYHTVLLHDKQRRSVSRFAAAMRANRDNGRFVQEISLHCEMDDGSMSVFAVALPPYLPNLKRVYLVWSNVHHGAMDARFFYALTRFTSVRVLEVSRGVQFPALSQYYDFIRAFSKHISRLSLEINTSTRLYQDGHLINIRGPTIAVSDLRLVLDGDMFSQVRRWFKTNITSLDLEIKRPYRESNFCDVKVFINSCGKSLERLKLVFTLCGEAFGAQMHSTGALCFHVT